MKLFTRAMKSKKYRGLLIAFARFDDGSQLLLTPKPVGGERIEAMVRKIRKSKGGGRTLPRS
jgi:hypothetical protein